jgi:hypothetical protein
LLALVPAAGGSMLAAGQHLISFEPTDSAHYASGVYGPAASLSSVAVLALLAAVALQLVPTLGRRPRVLIEAGAVLLAIGLVAGGWRTTQQRLHIAPTLARGVSKIAIPHATPDPVQSEVVDGNAFGGLGIPDASRLWRLPSGTTQQQTCAAVTSYVRSHRGWSQTSGTCAYTTPGGNFWTLYLDVPSPGTVRVTAHAG